MLLSEKWLADYVETGVAIKEFTDKMTLSGSKVEGYETEGHDLKNIVVGKLLTIERHPDSDHLWICSVDTGAEPLQIVTGAQNLKEGDIVPVALDNAVVSGGKQIKKGKLRGVVSCGMLCSLSELGLTTHDFPYAIEDGIFVLGDDCCQTLGMDIREAIGFNDTITEFEITPNRPDCLSVIGLAREAAATFDAPLTMPKTIVKKMNGFVSDYLSVAIEAPDKCYRYCGAVVQNVRVAPSPLWMRERLRASGVRPINNIVDITNFVMLELGQPMHAFDLRYVDDASIIVRTAKDGETITTLDGTVRALDPSMLVIADTQKPIAVAGVMGGEFSGIMNDTTTIVFESACFNGLSVRTTAKKLGMRTEASARYEKELDRTLCDFALLRALSLVAELDAGDVVGGIIDCYPSKAQPITIPFDPEWVNRFIGINVSAEKQKCILEKLEFKVENGQILVPSFRGDILHQADISEEIARFYGFENIPNRDLSGVADGRLTDKQMLENRLTALMTGFGASEIQTYSFISPKAYDKILLPADSAKRRCIVIQNPLGEDTSVMRTTALPTLLDVLARNYNNRNAEAFLFELATTYLPNGENELPLEPLSLVAGLYGENVDFFTLKGVAEELLSVLGIKNVRFLALSDNPSYHPGRAAAITVNGEPLGVLGEIHPDVLDNYGIAVKCYAFELSFDGLFAHTAADRTYSPLPKFPAMTRDLALVCDKKTSAGELAEAIETAVGKQLESVRLFDIYEGAQIPEGKKSLAFSLVMRSPDRTLTDEEADATVKRALKALSALGASIR